MQGIRYINSKNQSLDFGITPPLVLRRIEGVGNTSISFQTQESPYQDGSTYIGSKMSNREVFLQITIVEKDSQRLFAKRQEVQELFNPKHGEGYLEYVTANGVKFLKVVPDGTPVFSKYQGNIVNGQITLIAHDPFWYEVQDTTSKTFPVEAPINTKSLTLGETTVVNEGTAYSPLTVRIGESNGLTITNMSTGEIMKITKPINPSEELVIKTELGNRSIRLTQWDGSWTNGFSYMSMNSSFFNLDDGETTFKLEGAGNLNVKFEWKNRYIGL